MNPFDLTGKTILITGASSGIGRQAAIECAKLGATIILIGRRNNLLHSAKDEMEGSEHVCLSLDITEYESLAVKIKELKDTIGSISGIIHSAGISTTLPVKMVTPSKVEEYFKTNVFSAFELTRLSIKYELFTEKGGSVVFLSSVMAKTGEIAKSLYSMTKGSLVSGSRSLALELAKKMIRVNTISPGVVQSPMSKSAYYNSDPELFENIVKLHPLGIGSVTDVAYACVYLMSDASRWITGSDLVIDGGYTAR